MQWVADKVTLESRESGKGEVEESGEGKGELEGVILKKQKQNKIKKYIK